MGGPITRQTEQEIHEQIGLKGSERRQLLTFTESVKAYCTELKCSVTSWGRTERRNERVGGVDGSHHLDWLAVDVVYDNRPSLGLRRKLAERLGLTLIPYRTHDHLHPQTLEGGEVGGGPPPPPAAAPIPPPPPESR